MFIRRKGHGADHGPSWVSLTKSHFSWDKDKNVINITESGVGDFSTSSKHDYTIEMNLSEVQQILKLLGDKPVNNSPEAIVEELSPCLREIIRLEKVCIGEVGFVREADD